MSFLTMINEYFDKLLVDINKQKDKGSISSENVKLLWSLFGQSLFEALDLIDNGKVTLLSSSSGRQIIQVDHRASNHELPLLCMVDANFCTCHNYKFHGIGKEEFILCKHLIASRIAVALNGCKKEVISNDEMKNIIKRNFYD